MASIVLARKIAPDWNVPVISTKAPIISGPPNPPISATQKNRPPADPIYFDPTSGLSISISIRRGKNEEAVKPNITSPVKNRIPDVVTIAQTAAAAAIANSAIMRPLN